MPIVGLNTDGLSEQAKTALNGHLAQVMTTTNGATVVNVPQTLTLTGNTLTLSDGGGSVTLPSGGATVSTENFTGVI